MNRISRRQALGLGAAAGAGAVLSGASAATATATAAPTAATAARTTTAAPTATAPTRFTLTTSGLRVLGTRARPAVGDALTLRAPLVDDAGTAHGELFAHGTTLAGGGHRDDDEVASVQSHLFVLPHGTLTGHGTVDGAGRGSFTVTGGTGEFLGAHGGYTSTQHADRQGGDATFLFDLHRSAL